MSRLSLRVRLALAFAVAMAVVLAVAGTAVYLGVRETLDEQAAASPTVREEVREERDETLSSLLGLLLVGGPLALAAATTAGWLLAGAALRPVEAMRRRAAEISADTTGERLPVPVANDEIHRLGTTLNEMLDRLDAGLLRERRFVADASHERRTPRALLQTELELALRRPRSQEELEAALRSAAEEADRLVRLAEGLLLLATSDDVPLRRERFSVRDLLESVGRRFDVDVGEAEGELDGDRLRLESALANLVANALRHGAPPVRLDAIREGDRVVLRVTDSGPGFPAEFLPHAFERFTRADEARTGPGAGLGLAIAAAVARAHGGEATARNLSGPDLETAGAEVALSLPARRAAEPS